MMMFSQYQNVYKYNMAFVGKVKPANYQVFITLAFNQPGSSYA